MSGVKYSSFELERERKMCQEAERRIENLKARIQEFRAQVDTLLNAIPEGVQMSSPQEMTRVRAWQGKDIPVAGVGMTSRQLNTIAERLQALEQEGKACLRLVIDIKELRREARAKELIGRLEVLRSEMASMEVLLRRWRPDRMEALQSDLGGLADLVDRGAFVEVEQRLQELAKSLEQLYRDVTTLQAQDEQRWTVLEALRAVCCREMGWGEQRKPALERPNDPASPVLYEAQTYSAGIMSFRLTLEGIRVESPLSTEGGACYAEFGNLSERLKKFGVLTRFESLGPPEELPRLIAKGERDLPEGGAVKATERQL